MNIVVFGMPGAGKTTVAIRLAKDLGLKLVSSGALMREEIAKNSDIGKQIKVMLGQGYLAPPELAIELIGGYVTQHEGACNGFVFDGSPRTEEEAVHFTQYFDLQNKKLDHTIFIDVPEAVLVERLLTRGESSGRQEDTDITAITRRFDQYAKLTLPALNHIVAIGKSSTHNVNGDKDPDELYLEIRNLFQ